MLEFKSRIADLEAVDTNPDPTIKKTGSSAGSGSDLISKNSTVTDIKLRQKNQYNKYIIVIDHSCSVAYKDGVNPDLT